MFPFDDVIIFSMFYNNEAIMDLIIITNKPLFKIKLYKYFIQFKICIHHEIADSWLKYF